MKQETKTKKATLVGIILTVLISVTFLWGGYSLLNLYAQPAENTAGQIRANEIQAYRNLRRIAAGQEKYRSTDADGDGQNKYALFYIHLWRSVTPEGQPVRVGLVSKALGFAMDSSSPLNGYYYLDLRRRRFDDNSRVQEFDYNKEWGVAAIPAVKGKTGNLTFIVDQSGDIYAAGRFIDQPEYPDEPARTRQGWKKIPSLSALK